jgi:hypothetical protein
MISSRQRGQDKAGRIAVTDLVGHSAFAAAVAWTCLVAVAVAGRLWRPEWNGLPLWNVTPLAGVALVAGAVFRRPLLAATVPLAALAISNLFEAGYGSLAMAVVVYAATAFPVLLGGFVRPGRWLAICGGALASSIVFFLATNFAHWLLTADYPRTAAGLAACFTAALPFYRWMPVGDLAWSLGLFAGLALASRFVEVTTARRLQPVAEATAARTGRSARSEPVS